MCDPSFSNTPLPSGWPESVRSAVIYVISLAHYAITCARGWAANSAADEFQRLVPNRELLAAIAKRTGGELVEASDLEKFAARLPRLGAPETRTWSRSLWHTPLVFLLVLGCFAAEWIIRRRSGMA